MQPQPEAPLAPEPKARPSVMDLFRWIWSQRYPDQPLYLPPTTIRAVLALGLIGAMSYMQWRSPSDGAVPGSLVTLGSGAAGFYLGATNSIHMKAVISIMVIGLYVGFLMTKTWAPESLVPLASTAFGMYFAKPLPPKL